MYLGGTFPLPDESMMSSPTCSKYFCYAFGLLSSRRSVVLTMHSFFCRLIIRSYCTKDLNNLNVGESGDNSRDYSGLRKIFSIFLPFASSSINLSRYRIFCINGSSISSTRIPQTTPLIREAFGFILGA